MRMRKGQISFEYILVVGVAMLLLVPGSVLFFQYSQRSGDEMMRTQIDSAGKNIMDSVEKVYYIGENSWQTLTLDIPQGVRWIYILDNSELVVEYDSRIGVSQAVFFSSINITAPERISGKEYVFDSSSQHSGVRVLKVISMGSYVLLNETT